MSQHLSSSFDRRDVVQIDEFWDREPWELIDLDFDSHDVNDIGELMIHEKFE
jgi:hypothetical protein